jgi:hypothetical protein|tara:strand:- start:2384 stop:2974 length:591 start_codon:yes stop_codon:yes gene_type:complete
MTQTLITGITPSRIRGNQPNSNGLTSYPVASGAGAMYTGTPVRLSGGSLVPLVTSTEMPIGTFQGCSYVENGEQKFKAYYSGVSATNIVGLVNDNPQQTYIISSDTTVAAGIVGKNVAATNIAAGSTFTGRSTITALTTAGSVGTSAAGLFRVIGVVDEPGNAVGDPYTRLEVQMGTTNQQNFINVLVSTPVTVTN